VFTKKSIAAGLINNLKLIYLRFTNKYNIKRNYGTGFASFADIENGGAIQ
jgi:hypothetical protein